MAEFDANAEADRVLGALAGDGLAPSDFQGLSKRKGAFAKIRDLIKGAMGMSDDTPPAPDAPGGDPPAPGGGDAPGGDAPAGAGAPGAPPAGDYGDKPDDAPEDDEPDPQAGSDDMAQLGAEDMEKVFEGDVTELLAELVELPAMVKGVLYECLLLREELQAAKAREAAQAGELRELRKAVRSVLEVQGQIADTIEGLGDVQAHTVVAMEKANTALRDMLTAESGQRMQVRTPASVAARLAPTPAAAPSPQEFDRVALVKAQTQCIIDDAQKHHYRQTGVFTTDPTENATIVNKVRALLAPTTPL